MATSLLTASEKTVIDAALDDIHETFKRDIYAYVEESQSIPSDTNYNPLFGRTAGGGHSQTSTVMEKYTISARVSYLDSMSKELVSLFGLEAKSGRVRIKINSADYETVKKASKVEVDSVLYIVDSDAAIERPFSNNYYTIYLKRAT